ncbi:Oidioi.mRNA.OKI2018_I69.chr1.g3156.t1.cds [Oikopleura dioica]|uniref:Oidioi.mRNA.OKI2018_I69.chr1.g3156.t1.cds n=1 Tax=Oikopleura dioica TaxID=34765 RepID=A0ABN7T2H1_OIKDI|nr:Oidioi.mRNA.OKI2018_I69.chr1.g3156.t1.cds [Oikopleura dioica]
MVMSQECCITSHGCYIAAGVFEWIGTFLAAFVLCQQRQEIMRKSSIPTNYFKDYLTALCCYCCVLVQHERHVRSAAYQR